MPEIPMNDTNDNEIYISTYTKGSVGISFSNTREALEIFLNINQLDDFLIKLAKLNTYNCFQKGQEELLIENIRIIMQNRIGGGVEFFFWDVPIIVDETNDIKINLDKQKYKQFVERLNDARKASIKGKSI